HFPITIRWNPSIVATDSFCVGFSGISNDLNLVFGVPASAYMINKNVVMYNQNQLDAPINGFLKNGQSAPLYAVAIVLFGYDTTTSVRDILADRVMIYPNPVSNILNIETSMYGEIIAEIFDLAGRKISRIKMDKKREIDVSSLPSAVYQLKLTGSQGVTTKRWVKD